MHFLKKKKNFLFELSAPLYPVQSCYPDYQKEMN